MLAPIESTFTNQRIAHTMAKDESVPPVVPHVHTDQTGGAVLPIRGVSNPDSPTARLETTDTGRNEFSYEGPFMPLEIVLAAPAPTLLDYVRVGINELLATAAHYDDEDRKLLAREVENDVMAHRGFLLKSAFTNTAEIYVGNRFTGPVRKTGSTAHTLYQPKGSLQAHTLDKSARVGFDFGSTTPFGFALDPGESIFIEINRASNIYLYASTDQKLYWMAV